MKKFMSLLLSVLLILSLVPMTVSATSEDWNSFIYFQDGAEFSVEATEFEGSGNYTFYAAAYDAADRLVAVKKEAATISGDTLTADVNLEEGSTAAKLNVAKVKTMLWEGMTPLTRAGEFDIEDSYLIDGYYEPIAASSYPTEGSSALARHYWYNAISGPAASTPKADKDYWTQWGHTFYLADDDVTTAGSAPTGPNNQYYVQLAYALTAATALDRVAVVYSNDTDMQFYLSKTAPTTSENGAYLDKFKGASTDDSNLYYLGDKDSAKTVDGKRWLLADVDGEAYRYMIGDIEPNGDLGPIYEFQGFTKVTDEDIVDAFTLDADYNGLAYEQDGPEFSVEAQEFSTNATELYLVATAYDGANATGNILAQVSEPVAETATLTKSVNIEKNGVVASNMASVKVEVTDALGNNVLPAWTKNVTNPSYSLLSGLYTPITETVTYSSAIRTYWTKSADENDGKYCGQTWPLTPSEFYDGNLSTSAGTPSSASAHYVQNEVTFSAATPVDCVVAVYYTDYTPEFYLSKGGLNRADNKSYINKFTTDTTDNALYYLGGETKNSTTKDGKKWMIADADGDSYTSIIAHCENNRWGNIYEWQAYTKVQDRETISAFEVRADWESMTFSQDGPAFSVTATGFDTNADELYLVAKAYDSNGIIDAETRKEAATLSAGNLTGAIDFEEDSDNDEAPVSITKVVTEVQDAYGTVLAMAEFSVTAPTATYTKDEVTTTYAMTNGFYEAISGYETNCYIRYNNNSSTSGTDRKLDKAYLGSFTYNGNGHDNNLRTEAGGGNNPYTFGFGVARPAEKVDRVVLWVSDGYYVDGMQVYATTHDVFSGNNAADTAELKAFYDLFTTDKNDANIQYLGAVSGRSMAVGAEGARNVWDVDGGYTYRYLVCRYYNNGGNGHGGSFREFQGFKKVVATQPAVRPSAQ